MLIKIKIRMAFSRAGEAIIEDSGGSKGYGHSIGYHRWYYSDERARGR